MRSGLKTVTFYVPEQIYEQLRRVAFEERVSMTTVLVEALKKELRSRATKRRKAR